MDDELDSLEILQYKITEYCPGLEIVKPNLLKKVYRHYAIDAAIQDLAL